MAQLRSEFHNDLDGIRNQIALLGATVVELIPRATTILLEQDIEGAEYVLQGDREIDDRASAVEEQALSLLALQAPVAGDLRELAAALKLAPEIERSADLCGNLCKAARRLSGHDLPATLRGYIQRLSDQAQAEYKSVIDAYITNDPVKAAALVDMDEFMDDLHQSFVQAIFEQHAQKEMTLEVGVQLAMVARFYERLGDHAVNIAQRVIYIATGDLPEHDAVQKARETDE